MEENEETVTWCYDGDLSNSNSNSMASRAAAVAAYRLNCERKTM